MNIKILAIEGAEISNKQIIKCLAEIAENENVLYDVEPSPCGYFYDAEELLREVMEPALKNFLSEMKIVNHHADGTVDEFDADKYFDALWEYFYGGENLYCRSADLIAKSVESFIECGEWQIDLRSTFAEKQPHLIAWFGLADEDPIDYWTVDPYDEDSLNYWSREMDWPDILETDSSDCVSFWANECGIVLPDRSKLLESCPIKFDESEQL